MLRIICANRDIFFLCVGISDRLRLFCALYLVAQRECTGNEIAAGVLEKCQQLIGTAAI